MQLKICITTILLVFTWPGFAIAGQCNNQGVWLQVLGSGGPELTDQRASTGYLIWQDGRARVLVDMGSGALLEFEKSGARIEDLEYVLLTHLHVDHSVDLPALIKGSFFTSRNQDLPIYGPTGNQLMPDTIQFVRDLFEDNQGAFRYLGDYLTGEAAYRLQPHNVSTVEREVQDIVDRKDIKLAAIPVHHGPVPALAWRIELENRVLTISGDMNGDYHTLEKLARGSDLLVAHHAVPEGASGVARNLHMPPSVIGQIASDAEVGHVVLTHRMLRTLGKESQSEQVIRKYYTGPLDFADDGECYKLK
jgi:ribonuclease BN (tRNA processing enzyme)